MKNSITYILICILFAGAISGPVSFFINQKIIRSNIKKVIKAGLSDSQSEIIRIKNSEIENKLHFIHSKEFRYKGKLYDIIKIKKNADYTEYKVINDEKEEELIKRFKGSASGQLKFRSNINFVLLQSLTYITTLTDNFAKPVAEYLIVKLLLKQFHILTAYQKPATPPPRFD